MGVYPVARKVIAGLLLMSAAAFSASAEIEVEALFTDAAVLQIDGERKMLKAGQSYKGVTLVAAYSRTVTLEVDGQTMVLGLSRRIGTQYETAEPRVVSIVRDTMLQYQTPATINGRSMTVLVDTGANVVALNSVHAKALGVDFSAGIPTRVETASGTIAARRVTLRSINVGGIQVDNVEATVVEGEFPSTILLGMTYLRHVKIEESNGVLSLSRAW